MFKIFGKMRKKFHDDMETDALRTAIIAAAIVYIFLALAVNNKWVLATILVYEVLP